ncbi:hypothetical protein [Shewanella algidipiscicola]|uniref:Lipoprotein n=1 Tax=Shewanella algidipiscicola TaxID=614070 RepID=A0ABQ4P572_9GAMM|nr:hypothetical protein [Shewanella algidipiscicola]GIU42660.1 hypothetical protein TUM4630_04200 [Shewanella algidipiscicola]
MSIKSMGIAKSMGLIISILVTTACSTTDNKPMTAEQAALKAKNQQQLADAGYECRSEKVTGSSIKKRICDTRQQREERQNSDRDAINDLIRQTPAPKSN